MLLVVVLCARKRAYANQNFALVRFAVEIGLGGSNEYDHVVAESNDANT